MGRWRAGLGVAAVGCLAGGPAHGSADPGGPFTAPAARFQPLFVLSLARLRAPGLANLGYLGYMWELYAVWTWLPAILAASLARHGTHWSRQSPACAGRWGVWWQGGRASGSGVPGSPRWP